MKNHDVVLSPLAAADLTVISDQPPAYRLSGLTARCDGAIIALGGYSHLPDGSLLAFAWLSETARGLKFWLHREAIKMVADMRETGRPVIATASPDVPAAERWLDRLGFIPTQRKADNGKTIWVLHVV